MAMDKTACQLKNNISRRFNQWSANYDRSILQNLVFRNSHNAFVKEISQRQGTKINLLDVGCGTGEFVFKLAGYANDIQIQGVDLSRDMIRVAKSKANGDSIQFKVGDVEALPYESESFDIVTCSHSFHHYPNQKKAVKEMHRVLKDDGKLMIIDGSRDALLGKLIFGMIIKKREKDAHHILARELKELFHATGFRNITQHTLNLFIPLLFTLGIKQCI